jgi:hypothetical protein
VPSFDVGRQQNHFSFNFGREGSNGKTKIKGKGNNKDNIRIFDSVKKTN